MALPINIESLINGQTIEWERIEFKQGWNPEDIIHSMCAFANDIHNWGGGYVIIGVAENKGQPVLPPAGLQQNSLDGIQGEIVRLGHSITPNYFPITQPYVLQGQHILVLWCPAGDNRPYIAPSTLGNRAQRYSYIRVGSHSIVAQGEQLRQLQELTARIPFDDRINNRASINDFDLGLIRTYLQEIKSDLFEESARMSLTDLAISMHIAKGPAEDIRPVNVGLLFFTKEPELFFLRSWIELVWHKDNGNRNFTEHYFKGALHKQLRDTLEFLKNNIINEKVVKHAHKAEADRFYNFPYNAVEEALSNAVYHKSYEIGSPIEVQVWPDKIEILSFPGPVPPVNANILRTQRRIVAREYRNRRIGDFLKELRLTEGRGTGFPTIYNAMAANGSPAPVFSTDDNSTHVLVTLTVHPAYGNQANDQVSDQVNDLVINSLDDLIAFVNDADDQVSDQAGNQVSNQATQLINNEVHNRVVDVLHYTKDWVKRDALFFAIGLSNHSDHRKKYLDPLIELNWVEMEFPDTKTSPKQRYRATQTGKRILALISKNE
ncbi:MAG: putative DNA binding domain-containing protein [Salinivirgaceae bacterium]|nr:putative DNA binding domain-containing protein [Salinivirgaceae bacterium]